MLVSSLGGRLLRVFGEFCAGDPSPLIEFERLAGLRKRLSVADIPEAREAFAALVTKPTVEVLMGAVRYAAGSRALLEVVLNAYVALRSEETPGHDGRKEKETRSHHHRGENKTNNHQNGEETTSTPHISSSSFHHIASAIYTAASLHASAGRLAILRSTIESSGSSLPLNDPLRGLATASSRPGAALRSVFRPGYRTQPLEIDSYEKLKKAAAEFEKAGPSAGVWAFARDINDNFLSIITDLRDAGSMCPSTWPDELSAALADATASTAALLWRLRRGDLRLLATGPKLLRVAADLISLLERRIASTPAVVEQAAAGPRLWASPPLIDAILRLAALPAGLPDPDGLAPRVATAARRLATRLARLAAPAPMAYVALRFLVESGLTAPAFETLAALLPALPPRIDAPLDEEEMVADFYVCGAREALRRYFHNCRSLAEALEMAGAASREPAAMKLFQRMFAGFELEEAKTYLARLLSYPIEPVETREKEGLVEPLRGIDPVSMSAFRLKLVELFLRLPHLKSLAVSEKSVEYFLHAASLPQTRESAFRFLAVFCDPRRGARFALEGRAGPQAQAEDAPIETHLARLIELLDAAEPQISQADADEGNERPPLEDSAAAAVALASLLRDEIGRVVFLHRAARRGPPHFFSRLLNRLSDPQVCASAPAASTAALAAVFETVRCLFAAGDGRRLAALAWLFQPEANRRDLPAVAPSAIEAGLRRLAAAAAAVAGEELPTRKIVVAAAKAAATRLQPPRMTIWPRLMAPIISPSPF